MLTLQGAGAAREDDLSTLSLLEATLAEASTKLSWIDIELHEGCECPEALLKLQSDMDIRPEEIHHCLRYDSEVTVVEREKILFVASHSFSLPADGTLNPKPHEVHAFITANRLVTVHTGAVPAIQSAWNLLRDRRAESGASGNGDEKERTGGELYLRLARAVLRANGSVVHKIKSALNQIEPEAYAGNIPPDVVDVTLPRIIGSIAQMGTCLAEQQERFVEIAEGEGPLLDTSVRERFRGLVEETEQLEGVLERQGIHVDRLVNAFRLGISIKQNEIAIRQNDIAIRQNEVMKKGAILAAVVTPQIFVVGFFGMNFQDIPYDKPWLLAAALGAAGALSAVMVGWGYAKGWLRSEK